MKWWWRSPTSDNDNLQNEEADDDNLQNEKEENEEAKDDNLQKEEEMEAEDDKQHHSSQFGRTIIVNTTWESSSRMGSRTSSSSFFGIHTVHKPRKTRE